MPLLLHMVVQCSPLVDCSVVFVLVIIGVVCYRLALHPLAKYPGPLLAALTDWVTVYQTTTGDRHLDQLKEHIKYGPAVRVGPNTLSFDSVGAVKAIYGNHQANVRKAPWYTVIEASGGAERSVHAEVDREVHARNRRVLEHAFKDKSLRSFGDLIVDNVQTFADVVADSNKDINGWSEPFNMSEWATYLNYDIMGDLVFGRRFQCMTHNAYRFVPRLLMNSTTFIYTYASMPLKALSRRLLASGLLALPIIDGSMARDDRRFYEYADKVLDERIAVQEQSGERRQDIMHFLLHAEDSITGRGFKREQLKLESGLLIAAGADTTSATFAAAIFYLLHNSRVMDCLVAELRSLFQSQDVRNIAPSELMRMPYLRAVLDETMRLSPPVPSMLPREVLKGGMMIEGDFIPEGTVVGVSAYAIHHNPKYYPEPEVFYPERWIVGKPCSAKLSGATIPRTAEAVSTARQAFSAFSHGSRGCVGRQLAYHELHTALALLLYRFEIRLASDAATMEPLVDSTSWREGLQPILDPKCQNDDWRVERRQREKFQVFDRFLSDRNGPMVEFRSRV